MKHLVYKVINLINNKIYIGVHSTNNLNDNYLGSGNVLKKALIKYGKENFIKKILFICECREHALIIESEIVNLDFIEQKDTYNMITGGFGCFSISNETRQKISDSNKGKKRTEETKRKIGNAHKGKKISDEQKLLLSNLKKDSMIGIGNPMYGLKHSEESKLKMKLKKINKKLSEDHKRKLSKAKDGKISTMKGKKHSEETKLKMSKIRKGVKHSEEHKRKLSIINKLRSILIFYNGKFYDSKSEFCSLYNIKSNNAFYSLIKKEIIFFIRKTDVWFL